MQKFKLNISDREMFEYLMRVAVEDSDVRQRLTQILSSQQVGRKVMLELLLKHTKLQNAPAELKKVFIYLQDDIFATEVLHFLNKS